MRKLVLITAMVATAMPIAIATPAFAQGRETYKEQRECQRELSNADSRREYDRELMECQREIAEAQREDYNDYYRYGQNRYDNSYSRYGYGSYAPGYGYSRYSPSYGYSRYSPSNAYYGNRGYGSGYYNTRPLGYNDTVYRGSDGRYYCRRSDGTTGLIVGGAIGALIGNALDNGRSSLLGTLIGGAAGAALGREVSRGGVNCR